MAVGRRRGIPPHPRSLEGTALSNPESSLQRTVVLRVWGWGGLGFEVWGLGFGVWGLRFGVWGLGFGVLRLCRLLRGFRVFLQPEPSTRDPEPEALSSQGQLLPEP